MATFSLQSAFDLAQLDLGAFGVARVSAARTAVTYTLGDKVLRLGGSFTIADRQPVDGSITSISYTVGGVAQFTATGNWTVDLFLDALGNGDLPALFAGADTMSGRATADVLRGHDGHDRLSGAGGKDTLYGGAGDDTLDGGSGADRMQGGSGDDVYRVDNAGDRIVELANGGNDRVETTLAAFTVAANVETVTYIGSGAFTATGSAGANHISGAAGNDLLSGQAGNDVLRGANGNDTLLGGDGNDWLIGDAGAASVTTSASRASPGNPDVPVSLSLTASEVSTTTSTTVSGYINNASLGSGTFNLAFVLDVSGSMAGGFSGSKVGDVNGDGASNTKLDAAIASFEALVESIKAAGLGNMVRIGLIPFDSASDLRMVGNGVSDSDGNGVADVIDAARALDDLGSTYYDLGLQNAVDFFNGSPKGDNFVFFLSDGEPNGGPYDAILETLRAPGGINADIRALGIEAGSGGYYDVLDLLDDRLLNDSAINVTDPASLNAGLLNSQVDLSDIQRLEIYRNGTLVKTLAPNQLTQTPFGLKYSVTVPGLGSKATDLIEARLVLKDAQGGTLSTSQTITLGALRSNDSLVGGNGHDTLDGGAGVDTLVGGTGDDVYRVDSTGDRITELSGQGFDTVEAGISFSLNKSMLAQVEGLSLQGSGHTMATGNARANRIEGNIGNNVIQGLGGNDTLDGGFGIDTVSYANAARGFTVNLATGTAVGGSEVDTLAGFENVRGSRHADAITGDAKDNRFVGDGGNDTLDGGGGLDTADYASATSAVTVAVNQSYSGGTGRSANGAEGVDTLVGIEGVIGSAYADVISDGGYSSGLANRFDGGAGNDRLLGGGGSDTLVGGAGNDTMDGGANTSASDVDVADYSGARSAISGSLAGTIKGTSTGTDRLVNFEAIIATAYADSLAGSAMAERMQGGAGADTLSGGGGNDTLDGGAGSDRLVGGAGDDLFSVDVASDRVIEAAGGGIDTVESTASFRLASLYVENLRLMGTANLAGTGNAAANTITGNTGNNRLSGAAGNDTITGDLGDDVIIGGAGYDWLDGGAGSDTLSYAGNTSGVSGTLGYSAIFTTASGSDTVSGFEHLVGSDHGDYFTGDSYDNRIDGGAGNDSLYGSYGNDTLIGGLGNDWLDGGSGTDTVSYAGLARVGIRADLSTGVVTGQGTDTLVGVETLIGSKQADLIAWQNTATGTYTSFALTGGGGNDTLRGSEGNDTLDGGAGNDKMTGGGGSDTYHVNSTYDVVTEGSAYGTDTVISSISYTLGANVENLTLAGTAATGTGNGLNNLLVGSARANTLRGGAGSDTLQGGLGRDILDGGADTHADRFVYTAVADSRVGAADRIENFNAAYDLLDLGALDANSRADHDQSFAFLGTGSFTGSAGQLRYQVRASDTMVYADLDGDKVADFAIQIVGQHHLGISDFVL